MSKLIESVAQAKLNYRPSLEQALQIAKELSHTLAEVSRKLGEAERLADQQEDAALPSDRADDEAIEAWLEQAAADAGGG